MPSFEANASSADDGSVHSGKNTQGDISNYRYFVIPSARSATARVDVGAAP
jgi:hypothetical protein